MHAHRILNRLYVVPEVAVQRYYEIRQEYWRLRELSWADLDELKRRTHDLAILRAKLSSYVTHHRLAPCEGRGQSKGANFALMQQP